MLTLNVILLIFFVLVSGFFSASETALFSLSPMQVRAYAKETASKRRLIADMVRTPRQLLVTILMVNVLANILVQNFSSSIFGDLGGWGLTVGLPLVLTLLFGEVIPKSVALPNNERIANLVAPAIGGVHHGLAPLRKFITSVTSRLSHLMFFFLRQQKEISAEELHHALQSSEEHGVLTTDEAQFIEGYLTFQQRTVKEVVRPRGELLFYDTSEPLSQLIHLYTDQECSRVPICVGGLENIKGVMDATAFFLVRGRVKQPVDLMRYLKKPLFVPETMAARGLWDKLGQTDEEMAVVVDEYGSITGIVSREDLVEEIVGEIADRRDARSQYTRAGSDVIIASGKLEVSEFNEIFDCNLSSESSLVTVGGWLIEQLGYLPTTGTQVVVQGFLWHILAADPNRVRRIYVRRTNRDE